MYVYIYYIYMHAPNLFVEHSGEHNLCLPAHHKQFGKAQHIA